MKLIKAMATVAGLTGLSRILGFVRDILTASILGAGIVADAFFIALKLPNFFRRVTAEGAFSVSFVPMYSKMAAQDGQDMAEEFAGRTLSLMVIILSVFTALALWAMPYVIFVLAPGFGDEPARYDLAVELTRVTFPYLLLISVTALMGGILNTMDRFAPFASAPIFFNATLIFALLFLTPVLDTPGHAMAWGVLGAGLVQLFWLYLNIRKNKVRLRFKMPKLDPETRKLFKLMTPGIVGAGVMHINLFADMIIASLLEEGAISYLYYADRLNQLPLGLVGIAVGTALLPMLSKALAGENNQEAGSLFNRALEVCFLLALPASVALLIVPEALITVLFERGAFTAEDTEKASQVLMAYALGMPAYIAIKVFSTAYWARQDTLTPVKIIAAATVLNIILSLGLSQYIGVSGIALSTAFTGWIQFFFLKRGLRGMDFAEIDSRFGKNIIFFILASAGMGAVIYGYASLFEPIFSGAYGLIGQILILTGLVLSGFIVYGFVLLGTGTINKNDMKKILTRKKA